MAFQILSIAASAMQSSQLNLEISSQNLAGANNPNYSEQSVSTVPLTAAYVSVTGTSGSLGNMGVQNVGIQRAHSSLLAQNYRQSYEQQQSLSSAQSYLTNLEGQVTGSNDLSSLSANVTQSLATLQSNPADTGLQAAALESVQQLAAGFNNASTSIAATATQATSDMTTQVAQVNSDLKQLATINSQIAGSQSNSSGLNQVLDQRDSVLNDLSGLISTQVVQQSNGTVNLYSHGTQLLQFNQAEQVQLQPGNTLQTSSGTTLTSAGGSVGGLQALVQTALPAYKSQYDSLAASVINKLNAISQIGYGSDGVTGRPLLSGTDAATMAVAITDPSQLATAVSRLDGSALTTTSVAADQSLNSQAALLTTPAAASGVVSVNGTNISWTDGESINQVLSSFSAAGVTASFNSTTQAISLARDPTVAGPSAITISDVSGNLSSALGLTGTAAPGGSADAAGTVALVHGLQASSYGAGGTQTFQLAAQAISQNLGQSIATSQSALTVAQTSVTTATSALQAVTGVSSDQELLNVTKQDNAYQMAAKVASAVDDILTTLIKM